MTTTLSDRAVGAMLAAAAGDALGWPQEPRGGIVGGARAARERTQVASFTNWERNSGSRFAAYREVVQAGDYSDDTQLLLAVARSCLTDDWFSHLTQVELPSWLVYQRGGGRAVLRAARQWSRGTSPWTETDEQFENAGANGVAMRVLPHAIVVAAESGPVDDLWRRVIIDGIATHGHPRALVGALVYASAALSALSSTSTIADSQLLDNSLGLPSALKVVDWMPRDYWKSRDVSVFTRGWDNTIVEMKDLIGIVKSSLSRGSLSGQIETLEQLGALKPSTNGSGTVSAAAAIYLSLRSGTRPVAGMLQAAYAPGADTDTIASMAGGLLGAMHGGGFLGPLSEVQDATYISSLAMAMVKGERRSWALRSQSPRQLQQLLERSEVEGGEFVDGRTFRVDQRVILSEAPWVLRAFLTIEGGQSVVVDYVHRNRPSTVSSGLMYSSGPKPEGRTIRMNLPAEDLAALERAADAAGVQLEQFIYDSAMAAAKVS